jgi:CHAT domain-containing protein
MGGQSRLLLGGGATESALKAVDLTGYGILHFATHAVADAAYPERSAVVLNPGSQSEDGLLHPAEASALDLHGRAVVLSACWTAAGPVASGEGVLSLARAFFQGGAQTVVASRSRLRDDEAERLLSSLYDELGRGRAMGPALLEARRKALAERMPAATWAGLELLGDPDLSFAPARAPGRAPIVALAGLIGLAVLASARRRRITRGPCSSRGSRL